MLLGWLVAWALALVGHAALWLALVNWMHGTAVPRKLIKSVTLVFYGWLVFGPPVLLAWLLYSGGWRLWDSAGWNVSLPLLAYLYFCWFLALVPVPAWLWSRITCRPPQALLSNHTAAYDFSRLADKANKAKYRRLLKLPFNETLHLQINEKVIRLPRLPAELEGLSIAHLSDLHLTGAVAKEFFLEAVRLTNSLEADLTAITGDLLDKRSCLPWLPEILSGLRASYGVYGILGNHDLRPGVPLLRKVYAESNIVDLGGQVRRITVRDYPVVLAGNELPWIKPAPPIDEDAFEDETPRPLKILLSHTPDQFCWARHRQFDLMLAGHNHGGQIAFPLIGPIVCPSLHGVRYAGGVFDEPPTIMHVSRGVSGQVPFRWNSPPEVTRLVLTRG